VGHQLVRFLGRGVKAHRVIDVVMLGKRHALVTAVDAGTAGINEMFDTGVAAAFEDIDEADHVAVHIGMRIDQRIPHPGLGREVDHALRSLALEQFGNPGAVCNIQPRQPESADWASGAPAAPP
jgi:hypothetical protein